MNIASRERKGQRILTFKAEKLSRLGEWEHCVICGQRTDVKTSEPVNRRFYYVEGVGQLCPRCYRETASSS